MAGSVNEVGAALRRVVDELGNAAAALDEIDSGVAVLQGGLHKVLSGSTQMSADAVREHAGAARERIRAASADVQSTKKAIASYADRLSRG